jgi:signal transduction histidine kinase
MTVSPEELLHPRREREQTDASLREERRRTDATLANLSANRLADAAAELERAAADRVLRRDRHREDEDDRAHDADAAEVRRTLEQERLRADEALRAERARADEALDRERAERAEKEAAAFERERRRTDIDLGDERHQTDDILERERSAKRAAEGAAAEAASGLRAALEKAREALATRNAFLSAAAHELRTPLNTLQLQVQGFLQTARAEGNGAIQGRLKRVQAQVDRLGKLVNDILDVSRITAGRLPLERADVDLVALVSEVVERDREVLERALCELRVVATGPVVGRWDRQRLDQVVSNLLSNACKFGAEKPIRITIEGRERSARLVIEDQGIGISPEDSARLFRRFERAVSERNFGGLGLGLWLVRQIVEAHGGTVAVDGAVGVGARFTVELPRSLDHLPGQ